MHYSKSFFRLPPLKSFINIAAVAAILCEGAPCLSPLDTPMFRHVAATLAFQATFEGASSSFLGWSGSEKRRWPWDRCSADIWSSPILPAASGSCGSSVGWGWRGCFCEPSSCSITRAAPSLLAQRGRRKGDLKRRVQTGWISLLKDWLIKGFVLKH